jgi:phenylacetate-CoA ligase
MSEYETLRARHEAQFHELIGPHMARVDWSDEQLGAERERRLREIIAHAKEHSPWYSRRLADVEPVKLTPSDLTSIPPMTKHDLMENFDDLVTDRRLTRDVVEAQLDRLTDDAYLFDEYHCVASGGSSGSRGVFVYDWEGWLLCFLTLSRFRARMSKRIALPSGVRAMIAAGRATHMSYALNRTFGSSSGVVNVPATLPLGEIVAKLNELQPNILSGYPTMMVALASEARAGRLGITPRLISVGSEPLLPEMRSAIATTWSCSLINNYGTSEGAFAGSCGQGSGMHLSEDLCIFEPVDGEGRPVPAGRRAAKLYITRLFNSVQPLIRYELTDEVTIIDEPCSCGSNLRRIDDVEGRTDDAFVYRNGVVVHPLTFRSPLGKASHVLEYQVRQTDRGAAIAVRTDGAIVDTTALRKSVARELARAGLHDPVVTVESVDSFDRQRTGKLKRFLPRLSS